MDKTMNLHGTPHRATLRTAAVVLAARRMELDLLPPDLAGMVAGMMLPSCANTVYERAIWNRLAERP